MQMSERMKIELSTFIVVMERTVIDEKQMLGIKISDGKNPSALRHMSSLQRNYLRAEKRWIFLFISS